jgi:ankyrin repeat protein
MRLTMRPIATTLFAALLCGAVSLSAAETPATAADATPEIPRMTREQALDYVQEARLALTGSNLVNPIMNGDAEKVEALLSAGLDVNDLSDLPKPAVRLVAGTCAGKRVDTETMLVMLEVLLAHGAKVNEPEGSQLTALMVAAQHCPAPIVRRLLQAGAERDFRTPQGFTPLSMALLLGNYDAAEALIDAGARLSAEAAAKLVDGKKDDARLMALVKRARGK